jgi:outer membrane cobalamin receptor
MKKAIVLFLFVSSSVAIMAQEKIDVIIFKENQHSSKPLIVINGLKISQSDSISILDSIDPSLVSSVEVLKGDRAIEKYGADGDGGVVMIETSSRTQFEPLYIVDGKEVDNLKGINSDDIASMEVIKDRDKTIKYGDRAQRGVILIKMKNY